LAQLAYLFLRKISNGIKQLSKAHNSKIANFSKPFDYSCQPSITYDPITDKSSANLASPQY
jgi:hypothetical protein